MHERGLIEAVAKQGVPERVRAAASASRLKAEHGEGVKTARHGFDFENQILVVTGLSGSGKTGLLEEVAAGLLANDVDPHRVLWVDFADVRLDSSDPMLLVQIVDAFYRQDTHLRDGRCYGFLDNVDAEGAWEQALRRVRDVYDISFMVTGRQSPTNQGVADGVGASDVVWREMLPMSLKEYVGWCEKNRVFGAFLPQAEDLVTDYLNDGGLYVAPHARPSERACLLQALVRNTVLEGVYAKGLAAEANVGLAFAEHVLSHAARPLSISGAVEALSARGISTSRATLSSLLARMERLHVVYTVGEYGREAQGTMRLPYTVYAADHAIIGAFSQQGLSTQDVMRNAVYLELRRRHGGRTVFTYRVTSGVSANFALAPNAFGELTALVHVVDEGAEERAFVKSTRLLEHAMLLSGIAESTLVTLGTEKAVETSAGVVHAVPLGRWLVES